MVSAKTGHLKCKQIVEDCRTLDLAWLMRLGSIYDGEVGSGKIEWSAAGESIYVARFRLDLGHNGTARLSVWHSINAAAPIRQEIALTSIGQNFGGRRWWMRCPVTGERVRTLHLPPAGARFASRKALGLAYRVERLNHFDRPFEKVFRLQRKLGGMQGIAASLDRPKGMWRRTFARHLARLEQHELACMDQIAGLIKEP